MSGTYDNARDAIVTILQGITDIGKGYGYQRFITDWDKYLNLFKDSDGAIRGWYVTPAPNNTIQGSFSTFGHIARAYTFVIPCILSLKDSTETESAFMLMAEKILDAFLGRDTIGTATGQLEVSAASLVNYSYRQFGSVFCHYGEIALTLTVEVEG